MNIPFPHTNDALGMSAPWQIAEQVYHAGDELSKQPPVQFWIFSIRSMLIVFVEQINGKLPS